MVPISAAYKNGGVVPGVNHAIAWSLGKFKNLQSGYERQTPSQNLY